MAKQKVQVELDDETIAALDDLAQRQGGISRSEALRRAVATIRFLAEKEDGGAKLTVKESS
jgi:metal-responsive CopG/Arc/MetJ family transcriptional regulator